MHNRNSHTHQRSDHHTNVTMHDRKQPPRTNRNGTAITDDRNGPPHRTGTDHHARPERSPRTSGMATPPHRNGHRGRTATVTMHNGNSRHTTPNRHHAQPEQSPRTSGVLDTPHRNGPPRTTGTITMHERNGHHRPKRTWTTATVHHARPRRTTSRKRTATTPGRNDHHARPQRPPRTSGIATTDPNAPWTSATATMHNRNGPPRTSGVVTTPDRKRSSWTTAMVLVPNRNGHHARPEWSLRAMGGRGQV